jgi:phage terminase large subunit
MSDAARQIREWREDPAKFVRDNFQVEPDPWQLEALAAFAQPGKRRIAMQACAGPGKSTVLAWCAWNFMSCYGEIGQHPKAAAVSITGENLKTGLWSELAKWRQRSAFLQKAFEHTGSDVFSRYHPETWRLSAKTFPKKANADELGATLSGLHSDFIAYFIDESGGIHPAIGRAAEQGLSSCRTGVIMQAGNPLSLESLLYASVTKLRSQWTVIRISGDPDDALRSPRIDAAWAKEQIDTYGRDNPWVMIYILGKFPPASVNALIGPDECDIASKRQPKEDLWIWQPRVLGGDLARFGDDATCLVERQGVYCSDFTKLRNAKTQEIGGRIIRAKSEKPIAAVFLDSAMAGGVQDYCELLGHQITLVDFAGAPDDAMFANKRAEMMWTAANAIKADAMIPVDPEFIAEACAHTYTFNPKGQILIEPKDLVKKKLGRSPDKWDAYIVTYAHQVAIAEDLQNLMRYPGLAQSGNVGKARTERPDE